MKKNILKILLLVPLLFSCKQNIPNPSVSESSNILDQSTSGGGNSVMSSESKFS